MKPIFSDTDPRADAVYIEMMRATSPSQRLKLARNLSAATISRAREAMKRARPEASTEEIDLWFVELNYGRDLAERLREYNSQRIGHER